MITKAKRHKIYKDALKHYIDLCNRSVYLGICNAITSVSEYDVYNDDEMKLFPEIYKHKPSELVHSNNYWWSIKTEDRGTYKRREVLKEAIELTKPKKKELKVLKA